MLATIEHLGASTMTPIRSENPDLTPSAIKRVLDALEAKGLVAHAGNERSVYIDGVTWIPTTRSPDGGRPRTGYEPNDTIEIGFREDGVMWLTQSPSVSDAASAQRYLGTGWRVIDRVWLGWTGQMANSKDEAWDECGQGWPGARPGWRLALTTAGEIFVDGEWLTNPYWRRGDRGADEQAR